MRWVKRDKTFSGRFYSSDPPGYRKIVLLLLPFCWLAAFGGRNRGHKMCRVRAGRMSQLNSKREKGGEERTKVFLTTAVGKEIVVSPPPLFLSLSPFLSQYLTAGVRSFRRRERNREKCILFSFPPPPPPPSPLRERRCGGKRWNKVRQFSQLSPPPPTLERRGKLSSTHHC